MTARRAGANRVATFRNSRGEVGVPASVTTREAKHEFWRVLDREFDALLAGMQTPRARRGMKRTFAASGKALGTAAVAAATVTLSK